MISPGKRWFLYRSLVAGGVMSGCLSWSSSGQGGVITRTIMSWVRKQVQQVDKTTSTLASLCTLTHGLDLLLRNPRQGARGFEFTAQLLSQNTGRKGDLGTTAMATIGQPHTRPISQHLVAQPQHADRVMATCLSGSAGLRWRTPCGFESARGAMRP